MANFSRCSYRHCIHTLTKLIPENIFLSIDFLFKCLKVLHSWLQTPTPDKADKIALANKNTSYYKNLNILVNKTYFY